MTNGLSILGHPNALYLTSIPEGGSLDVDVLMNTLTKRLDDCIQEQEVFALEGPQSICQWSPKGYSIQASAIIQAGSFTKDGPCSKEEFVQELHTNVTQALELVSQFTRKHPSLLDARCLFRF